MVQSNVVLNNIVVFFVYSGPLARCRSLENSRFSAMSLFFGSTLLSDFHIKGTDYRLLSLFIVDLRICSLLFNSCSLVQNRCTAASRLFIRCSMDILEIDASSFLPACGLILPPRHHPNGVLKAAGPGR